MNKRLTILAFVIAAALLAVQPAYADTPTPSPTPTPPGFNHNSNFSVDNNAALPWPLPVMPTFPVASATPTLHAATPPHATGYPNQVATATAQIGVLTSPINGITTPVAALVTSGPQPGADDIEVTGADGDPVSVSDFLDGIGDTLGDAFAAIRAIPDDLAAISPTFLVVALLLTTMIIAPVLRSGLELAAQIIKALMGVFRAIREIVNTLALIFK